MHYTLRVNEQQFGDLIAAIICAEAAEAEAIELFTTPSTLGIYPPSRISLLFLNLWIRKP